MRSQASKLVFDGAGVAAVDPRSSSIDAHMKAHVGPTLRLLHDLEDLLRIPGGSPRNTAAVDELNRSFPLGIDGHAANDVPSVSVLARIDVDGVAHLLVRPSIADVHVGLELVVIPSQQCASHPLPARVLISRGSKATSSRPCPHIGVVDHCEGKSCRHDGPAKLVVHLLPREGVALVVDAHLLPYHPVGSRELSHLGDSLLRLSSRLLFPEDVVDVDERGFRSFDAGLHAAIVRVEVGEVSAMRPGDPLIAEATGGLPVPMLVGVHVVEISPCESFDRRHQVSV